MYNIGVWNPYKRGETMTKKTLIFLIFSYIAAFVINLIPSIKHPDSNVTFLNLLVTVLFIITLLVIVRKATHKNMVNKSLNLFLIFGVLSGLVVYVITKFEHITLKYAILDVIASIHYPFYIIFITPLFGLNYLFDVNYEVFSLWMSLVYLGTIILLLTLKRLMNQSA